MRSLLLLPFMIATTVQAVACVAWVRTAPTSARSTRASRGATLCFASSALLGVLCVLLAHRGSDGTLLITLSAFVLSASLAPLLASRCIGTFHAAHHVVRLIIVTTCVVLYWVGVHAHR